MANWSSSWGAIPPAIAALIDCSRAFIFSTCCRTPWRNSGLSLAISASRFFADVFLLLFISQDHGGSGLGAFDNLLEGAGPVGGRWQSGGKSGDRFEKCQSISALESVVDVLRKRTRGPKDNHVVRLSTKEADHVPTLVY